VKSLSIPLVFFVAVNILFASAAYSRSNSTPLIVNHNCTRLSAIPNDSIQKAKSDLHIAYGHTSHGSQLISGMTGLVSFKGTLYSFSGGGQNGSLDLRDTPFTGAYDLGNPDFTSWAAATRNYLASHTDINVIIWSWCGETSYASKTDIDTYLSLMSGLEKDYPGVSFVYMTGHHDGTGLAGNLHIRNEQIREYCRANNKILYDFNDIETYDPDGQYFGDKIPTDNCDYDSNGDGKQDSNWALEWQNAHPGVWYNCDAAHSQPLNGNLKAYAAWWLWSSLAGWTGETTDVKEQGVIQPELFNLRQNFPNPFNPSTAIRYELGTPGKVSISVYNTLGQQVNRFDLGQKEKGAYEFLFDGSGLTSGVYFYLAETGYAEAVGKMVLMK
jgi:hypothetical protein